MRTTNVITLLVSIFVLTLCVTIIARGSHPGAGPQPTTCPSAFTRLTHPDAPTGTFLCIPSTSQDVITDMDLNYGWDVG